MSALVIGFTTLFPIIIAALTGNWWYLFLYFVIWIPVSIEMFIFGLILELFD
jgi:hypothetical protein